MKQQRLASRSIVLVVLTMSIYLPGCSGSVDDNRAQVESKPTTTSTEAINQKVVSKQPAHNRGVVKSVQTSGGYSYIEVDISGDIFWLATSVINVKPGANIAWSGYAMMTNFTSKTLNREFKQILFVDKVVNEATMVSQTHNGVVIETMNSAGYSYIQVEENGARVWLAVPETRIESGQSIVWQSGTPMRNFTSQSLNRHFEEIFFVSAIQAS